MPQLATAEGEARARAIDPREAWAPFEPDQKSPWDLRLAGHLLRRAAFGGTWPELKRALEEGPQKTVDRLLRPEADADDFNRRFDDLESGTQELPAMQAWWLRRMIQTPHPLLEKMTLFWHGHVVASKVRVQSGPLLLAYVRLLRGHALGRLDAMLAEVARDPAMLTWLEATANRKSQPTEHFARTLFERFTLGPGEFSDRDVREASRAFTGWFVLRNKIRFIEREHDDGVKRVLGKEGNFAGEDVVKIALAQPAAPKFVVARIYRWLISETDPPSEALLAPLAEQFAADYDIARLVETVLRSNLFFSPAAYRQRVKSPVELAVGILRPMEAIVPTDKLGRELAEMGQSLYAPPTAGGWAGGRHWINQATMLRRDALGRTLFAPKGPYAEKLDPKSIAAGHGVHAIDKAADWLIDLYLQGDLAPAVREKIAAAIRGASGSGSGGALRRFAQAIVSLPEFQLS